MLLNENKYTKKRTDMREMNVVFFYFSNIYRQLQLLIISATYFFLVCYVCGL